MRSQLAPYHQSPPPGSDWARSGLRVLIGGARCSSLPPRAASLDPSLASCGLFLKVMPSWTLWASQRRRSQRRHWRSAGETKTNKVKNLRQTWKQTMTRPRHEGAQEDFGQGSIRGAKERSLTLRGRGKFSM